MSRLRSVLQSETGECGLACLVAICNDFGLRVDIGDLRRRFSLSTKGCTLTTLIQHAEALELSARPLRLELNEIGQLRMPCILHWNLNHFVVLERVSKTTVSIMDPAFGLRKLSLEAVSRHFTGVAVELIPSQNFHGGKEGQRLQLRDLLHRTIGLRTALTKIFLLGIALEAFALIAPVFNQLLIDEVLVTSDREFLYMLATGFGLLIVVQTSIEVFRTWIVVRVSADIRLQWVNGLFSHLVRLPATFFEKRHAGDITSRFGSIVTIQQTLTAGLVTAILDALMGIMAIGIMLAYSPTLALIAITAMAAYGGLRRLFYTPLREAHAEHLTLAAKENSHFLETLRTIVPIKLFGQETPRRTQWQKLMVEVIDRDLKTQNIDLLFTITSTFITAVAALWLLTLGAIQVMENRLSVGMLMAFSSYAGIFSARVTNLITYSMELKMLELHGDRLADIALEKEESRAAIETDLHRIRPHLKLHNIGFRYADGEPWVLRNLNLEVTPEESIAIIGRSGCGKSTLIKIMLGLLSPTEGEVLIDGIPVKQLGLCSYQQLIGTVVQDDSLIAGSIAENITFFSSKPDQMLLETCAQTAAIHHEICSMPMGYQTLVGDMGSNISGGQKQRILLARALYKQPKLLIFDEATSHLDAVTEKYIIQQLDRSQLTRIHVAHRAETIASAQRVVTLEKLH